MAQKSKGKPLSTGIGRRPFEDLSDEALLEKCRFKPWEAFLYNHSLQGVLVLAGVPVLVHGIYFFWRHGINPALGWFAVFGSMLALLCIGLFEFAFLATLFEYLIHTLALARTRGLANEIAHRQGAGRITSYVAEAGNRFAQPDPPDWILLIQTRHNRYCEWDRFLLKARAAQTPEDPLVWEGWLERWRSPAFGTRRRNALGQPFPELKNRPPDLMGLFWRCQLPAELAAKLAQVCQHRPVPEPEHKHRHVYGFRRYIGLLGRDPRLVCWTQLVQQRPSPRQRELNQLCLSVTALLREFAHHPDLAALKDFSAWPQMRSYEIPMILGDEAMKHPDESALNPE